MVDKDDLDYRMEHIDGKVKSENLSNDFNDGVKLGNKKLIVGLSIGFLFILVIGFSSYSNFQAHQWSANDRDGAKLMISVSNQLGHFSPNGNVFWENQTLELFTKVCTNKVTKSEFCDELNRINSISGLYTNYNERQFS
jgi:hypothetical protein